VELIAIIQGTTLAIFRLGRKYLVMWTVKLVNHYSIRFACAGTSISGRMGLFPHLLVGICVVSQVYAKKKCCVTILMNLETLSSNTTCFDLQHHDYQMQKLSCTGG